MATSSLRSLRPTVASVNCCRSSSTNRLSDGTRRAFSASPASATRKGLTSRRKAMWTWLKGPGAVFEEPRAKRTNYINAYQPNGAPKGPGSGPPEAYSEESTDDSTEQAAQSTEELQPFPLNPHFISPNVLSLPLRDEIYRRVVEAGQTVREVAQSLGVSMERVGAVVRLKTIENDTIRENKPMAKPYQRAMLNMLPQTPFLRDSPVEHEPINNLPVHRATLTQIFHPTSESRHFTRKDAGKVFHHNLLPADERIPHPDMIVTATEMGAAMTKGERDMRRSARWDAEMTARDEERQRQESIRAKREMTVEGQRWDFKITKVQIDNTGNDERNKRGVGWRYGHPLPDRKKGQVWIPTKVE